VVEKTGQQIRQRVLRYLKKQGDLTPHEAEDMLTWEHGGGFSLDASVKIAAWDRDGLEKLARYCARPSFAEQRLSLTEKNQVLYVFPKPMVDGQLYTELDPLTFLQKLSAIIPPPWVNLVKYFGVLAPNAKLREKVVATAGPSEAVRKQLLEAARKMVGSSLRRTPLGDGVPGGWSTGRKVEVYPISGGYFEITPDGGSAGGRGGLGRPGRGRDYPLTGSTGGLFGRSL